MKKTIPVIIAVFALYISIGFLYCIPWDGKTNEQILSAEAYTQLSETQQQFVLTSIDSTASYLVGTMTGNSDSTLAPTAPGQTPTLSVSSVVYDEKANTYQIAVKFEWPEETLLYKDRFLVAFNDEQWGTEGDTECRLIGEKGVVELDRPSNGTFSGVLYELPWSKKKSGEVVMTMAPREEEEAAKEVLVGYIRQKNKFPLQPAIKYNGIEQSLRVDCEVLEF